MPEISAIHQEQGKPLVAEKEGCAVSLNMALAEFEAKDIRGYYTEDAFEIFFIYFRRLVTITQHEKSLKDAVHNYGRIPILSAVDRYFNSDVRKNYVFGIKLARAYLKALFHAGILSSR